MFRSPVHNFDSLWQLVPCQMEDGCNEDGEQRWSNDASLLNSCVDLKGFRFVSRAGQYSGRHVVVQQPQHSDVFS